MKNEVSLNRSVTRGFVAFFFLFFLKSLHLMSKSVGGSADHSTCEEVRGHFMGLVSFLLLYGSWGIEPRSLGLLASTFTHGSG